MGMAPSKHEHLIAAVALLSTFCSVATGGDLYTMTGSRTLAPSVTATASGSSFIDLVRNASDSSAQFSALKGHDATYTLTSAGNTVMTLTRNAAGTRATLSIPSTGFSHTFSAARASALSHLISDYLRRDTDGVVSNLNHKLTSLSKVNFVDGNPHAVTALMADDAFYRFGMPRTSPTAGAGWWFDSSGGAYHAAGLNGNYGSLGLGFDIPFGQRAALSLGYDGQYAEVGGSQTFTFAGLDVGLPITIFQTPLLDGWIWRVTPFGEGTVNISPDTASGGVLYSGGAVSSLNYVTGPWTFTLADQVNYFAGVDFGIGGRVYGTHNLDQWLTKNGVNVSFMPAQHLFFDGGVTWNHFFESAATRDYLSPTVGIGWRFTPSAQVRVGARGDFANGYTSYGGEVLLAVSY